MATKQPSAKPTEQTFETALQRLEQVVEQMESDSLPLEGLLTHYEEGIKLVQVCQEKLTAAEKRIEMITRNATGEPQLEEFEPEKKPAAPSGDDVSLF
jgi:exodeoxyribonuclease VII small subunit